MMHTSRSVIFAIILAFLALVKCTYPAPQYFLDTCLHPIPPKESLMFLTPDSRSDLHEMHESYPMKVYPMYYLWADYWFSAGYPLDRSLVPPIHEQNDFGFVGLVHESKNGNEFQRGRSDIDPIEDNEEFGYFYPKPKITFDLPEFTPLSGASDAEANKDVTIATTTTEEITDKITTALTPETSSGKILK